MTSTTGKRVPRLFSRKTAKYAGVGGPSIITSPDGKDNYLLYHAYLGQDTTGYSFCFMEPYYVNETGFHVGQNNSPSPLATEFSIEVNPMPIADKISGFKIVYKADAMLAERAGDCSKLISTKHIRKSAVRTRS